jgi:hypothetical protein
MTQTSPKRTPSAPSTQTLKRLFGESGNLCAFAKCQNPIIQGASVFGEVCHIKGKKPDSPRYDSAQSDEDRHGYGNLILMCAFHHGVIDTDEQSYTVERLQQIKSAHLQRAAQLPEEETERGALLLFSPNTASSVNQSGGITAANVTVNNYTVAQNEQGKEFAKPTFAMAEPQEGSARFRKSTEPLGVAWGRINQEQFDVGLATGRAVWLRLMPVDYYGGDFGPLDLKRAATSGNFSLMPLVDFELGYLLAEDGFGVCNQSSNRITNGVAFAFSSGEVWSIDTNLLTFGDNTIYFDEIAKHLANGLSNYARFLSNLGIEPPYSWIGGIEGVSRMKLVFEGQGSFATYFAQSICMTNSIAEGGQYDGTEDPWTALNPLFREIFKKSATDLPARLRIEN